ncbi:Protein of unknown function (DUF3231) [Desulfosporosinus acidiphilus SJ4]|uniref:DUF3231 family protein n=1 Tax=Desulfosporosinus acidiphilus (strain DSM 22704 / JCM 16185 / SJ4) TaxID=646529 RepID=I4D343_DESAJ|nr:DUF3231 family protein [Desulfosporosinus acidiphilus]AFM40217.1 Protein of unknown function (DUF3231) [Desulfosporosinus acidiphilus SJ4]
MNTSEQFTSQTPMDTIPHNISNIMPTSAEIGFLWQSYFAETMSLCMLKYIIAKSKDPACKPVFQHALDVSSQRVTSMEDIFNTIKHPIPDAFGEKDVDINASELFSEDYLLTYTKFTNKYILLHYCQAFAISTRTDFINFFNECIDTSRQINKEAKEVLLAKGLLLKPPYIVIPDKVDYVHNDDYFGSFWGRSKRPLNALEVGYLYDKIESKLVLETLSTGLAQVVEDKKVKDHLIRGKEISNKQIEVLSSILESDDLPLPSTSNFQITTSRESPFSAKLILFHSTVVTAFTILSYGLALTNSARKDVVASFGRLIVELLEYSKDGTDLLIERGWLERVPETADRKKLLQ